MTASPVYFAAVTQTLPEPVPGYDTDDQVRRYALDEQRLHNPKNQGHGYDRCEHCHFTRHPCDVYELASVVLFLLDRGRTDDPWERIPHPVVGHPAAPGFPERGSGFVIEDLCDEDD